MFNKKGLYIISSEENNKKTSKIYKACHTKLRPSHFFKMYGMGNNGMAHLWKFYIPDTVLLAGLFNYFTDGRVVYV